MFQEDANIQSKFLEEIGSQYNPIKYVTLKVFLVHPLSIQAVWIFNLTGNLLTFKLGWLCLGNNAGFKLFSLT